MIKTRSNPRSRARRVQAATLALLLTVPVAAQSVTEQTDPPPPASTPPATRDGDTIVLTPFQVTSERDQGYFAENTLAGSRLRTNIADLASSISVVTKQQMEDTASLDINDVFRYEINTEGSSTYTPAVSSMRADGIADVNAGFTAGNTGTAQTNATANRVRGLGTPSTAINYYPAIGQVPFDAYNVQSLEISRGPNSLLFGMGSPAGIVNQSTAQAVVNRDSYSVQLRGDDRGSRRASFSFNKGLVDDRLAVYGAFLYDDRQFERKPSYDITRRQYGALTYRPFRRTTIRAFVENYDNDNRRPNTLTPRDFVTEWRNAGQPVYNALTKTITKQATGEVIGPYISSADSPLANNVRAYIESRPGYNPALWNAARTSYNGVSIFGEAALTNANSVLHVPGITWLNQPRTAMQIADGEAYWYQPLGNQRYRTAWGTATNPQANADLYPPLATIWANPTFTDVFNRYTTGSTGWDRPANIAAGSYRYPGVTDKSIYDWESVNINQMNFGTQSNQNYNIELEQELARNLHFSAGWFRQDFESISNYTVAQLNVTTLFVDTNLYRPNGEPNPYFGQVYVEDQDPDQFINRELHDHYRAMLAYTPDFTNNDGWSRWLGRHQILGLASHQDSMQSTVRKRLQYMAGDQAGQYRWMANQNVPGWNYQTTSLRRQFYLSRPGDPAGTVTTASGEWNPIRYTGDIEVFNYATGQFETISMTTEFTDFEAGTGRNQRLLDSISAGMTSYFWQDRIITTVGVRRDDYKARNTTTGQVLDYGTDAQGRNIILAPALTNAQKWVNGEFQRDLVYNRWQRYDELAGNTKTLGLVVKPFQNWDRIDQRANQGSLWWQFVRDLGFSYNQSDNFNAPSEAQTDAFGNPLPKPTGEGRDIGLQFSLMDNKLFARITWFEATNENERTNPGASISRLTNQVDQTLFRNWAQTIALINLGYNPEADGFASDAQINPIREQLEAATAAIWQLPYAYYTSVPNIFATRNAEAEGVELQVTYNPTRNWTMKLTAGKQETVYTNVLREFDAWYAVRNPVWQAADAADFLLPQYQQYATYTTFGGRPVDLTNFWTSYGYNTAVTQDDQFGNTNVSNYYRNNVTSQYNLARDLEGQAAPGQREYRAAFLTNYTFDNDTLRGWSLGGSLRWEDSAVIGYYGRPNPDDPANPNLLALSDVSRPIYDSDNWYTDVWVGYTRRIFDDKVRMKLQLNVVDVLENGGLKTVGVNYDGSPNAFRIVDPRQFILTASFDF